MLLAGDIGGTKTLLALYDRGRGARTPVREQEYLSADWPDLGVIVRDFLGAQSVQAACFDVAGPVVDGRARITNLPWVVERDALRAQLGIAEVGLLNDLQAVSHAVPRLLADEFTTLNAGTRQERGAIAVVAPGTGLGEGFLVWDGTQYRACPSEGGHADFAPTDARQAALWRTLHDRLGHVSTERVCSGSGIPNLYAFAATEGLADPAEFAAELAQARDRTPLILQAALHRADTHRQSAAALDLFVRILGATAGNLALKVVATGGVYLGGGLPPRMLGPLADGRFMQAFADKGRLGALLKDMPVHVITTRAALLGAALYGLDRLPQ